MINLIELNTKEDPRQKNNNKRLSVKHDVQ